MEKEKQNKQNKPGKERKEGHPDPGKIIDFVGSNMILSLVSKRYPNNTNLNITTASITNGEKDAVVVVVKNCIIYC